MRLPEDDLVCRRESSLEKLKWRGTPGIHICLRVGGGGYGEPFATGIALTRRDEEIN